jgi:5-methylcytosine-specific restriction protein B
MPSNVDVALEALMRSKALLVSGPPGTGKTTLLNLIAKKFLENETSGTTSDPLHNPTSYIPIPERIGNPTSASNRIGSTSSSRRVFRTVFHQNTKHRDFISGLEPMVGTSNAGAFRVQRGTLLRASDFAMNENSFALLIIDEINRGPAVQIFGGAIAGLEPDKRLASDLSALETTQYFEILNQVGELEEYALPPNLFLVAAMNLADAAVEPLDVAFLRRWEPLKLYPDEVLLRHFFGLPVNSDPQVCEEPKTALDVFEASVLAWREVNKRIVLGRGVDYQVGHGVLMVDTHQSNHSIEQALSLVAQGWSRVLAHVEEVYFGDARAIVATLNGGSSSVESVYTLREELFADSIRVFVDGPLQINNSNVYQFLKSVIGFVN